MTDEIERRLDDARACLAKASNTYDMSAIFSAVTDIYAAVRLLAARPAPAGGAGEMSQNAASFDAEKWDSAAKAWALWCQINDVETSNNSLARDAFEAGWDAARAADAARGERGG